MASWVGATLFLTIFSAMLGSGLVSPLMAIYARDFGATGILLGLIFGSFGLARLFVNPIVGRLSDIKGRKKIIVLGILAYSVTSLAYIVANDSVLLTFVRFLHGGSSAMVIPVAMAYAGDLVPKGKEARGMVLYNMAMTLGFASGPLLGGVLTERFGIASSFLAMFVLSIVALVLVVLGLPESSGKLRNPSYRAPKVKITKPLAGLMAFRTVMSFSWSSLFVLLSVFAEGIRVSLSSVGLILTVNVLTLSLFQLVAARLADRYDKVRLGVAGALVSLVSVSLIPFSRDFAELLLLNIFMGIGTAFQMAVSLGLATELGREIGLGSTFGLLDSAMSVAGVVGPIFVGAVFDAMGFGPAFIGSAMGGLIGVSAFIALFKGKRKELELQHVEPPLRSPS